MTRTTWDQQELPLLRRVSELPALDGEGYYKFTASLDLSPREASEMLRDLRSAQYIEVQARDGGERFTVIRGLRLAPMGRRALGLWPRDDSQAEQVVSAMMAVLEGWIQAAETEEDRSKLRVVLEGLRGAGRDVIVSVLAEVGKRATGLS